MASTDNPIKIKDVSFDIENKKLKFTVYFDKSDTYSDYHFLKISIDTDDTFECINGASGNATNFSTAVGTGSYYYTEETDDNNNRQVVFEKTISDTDYGAFGLSNLENNLYCIFVNIKDSSGNEIKNVFYIYNKRSLHDKVFDEVEKNFCNGRCLDINIATANQVIFFNGFNSSLKIGDIKSAIKYFKLIKNNKDNINSGTCNCH